MYLSNHCNVADQRAACTIRCQRNGRWGQRKGNDLVDEDEKQQLHEDVRQFLWKLAGFDMLRVECMGDMFIMGDKFLEDFSKAWGNVRTNADNPADNGVGVNTVRRYTIDEMIAHQKQQQQQKQTATTITIGGGPTYISASEGADRLTLHGGTGYIPIDVDEIDEVIAALQRLRTLLKEPAAPTSSAHNSGPKSRQYEQHPNHPGYVSQAEKNDIALKRALGIDY